MFTFTLFMFSEFGGVPGLTLQPVNIFHRAEAELDGDTAAGSGLTVFQATEKRQFVG